MVAIYITLWLKKFIFGSEGFCLTASAVFF